MEKFTHIKELLDRLDEKHTLTLDEYEYLVANRTLESAEYAASLAVRRRQAVYGNDVYIRGLIEISSYCKNDCYYCGIRRSNRCAERYRLTEEQILSCADEGYELGFRTFVMQGGEDPYYTDERMCSIIGKIKSSHPDCAVTLSLGERSYESYRLLREAGADRYLLRHETADREHYARLHPEAQTYDNRMECLYNLKKLGYQVGVGFMVGSPYQTPHTIAEDIKFIEEFSPAMCGIGPFIPHHDTDFRDFPAGSAEETVYLLSLIRLIKPNILLPATTALGTIDPKGREKGISAGANVVMPNLSPVEDRKKYSLYDNKVCTGDESAQCRSCIERRINSIGYRIVTARGDVKNEQ